MPLKPSDQSCSQDHATPASIPAFDRAMRGLIQVPKAELDAELKKSAKPVKGKPRRRAK